MAAEPRPGLSVRAARAVAAGLRALGHPAEEIFRRIDVEIGTLDDPEARIPHAQALGFWDEAVAATGDDTLGLHVAEMAPLEAFDVHGYALLSSATLHDAFTRACRYQRLIHDTTQLTLQIEGERATLRHALPGGRPVPRQAAEFLIAAYIRLGRLASGGAWQPLEAHFAHAAPADTREHDRVLGVPARFGIAENAVVSAASGLELPNPKADAGLVAVLDRYADTIMERLPSVEGPSARVRAQLAETLCDGAPTAAEIAKALGMSPRTLSRRLAEEQTSYADLLEQYRRERALALLDGGRASIAEVTFLLGFSELSAFYRAFKRWTGTTPGDYRKTRA